MKRPTVDAALDEAFGFGSSTDESPQPVKKSGPLTPNKMATAIEDRHPQIELRYACGPGNDTYPQGCWVIERWSAESGSGGNKRLRFLDNVQLKELYEALGDSDEFWRLVSGDGLPGPLRVGKPQIDAHGVVTEFVPDAGYGPLQELCRYIEAHDNVVVKYLGDDPITWPKGCWEVADDTGEMLFNRRQIEQYAKRLGYTKGRIMTRVKPAAFGSNGERGRVVTDVASLTDDLDEAFGASSGFDEAFFKEQVGPDDVEEYLERTDTADWEAAFE